MPVPEGALLCSLEIEFPPGPNLFFDDHFLFAVGEGILATSQASMTATQRENSLGYLTYDWGEIGGRPLQTEDVETYCHPSADCTLPEGGRGGEFLLSIGGNQASALAWMANQQEDYDFLWAAFGDNDREDCQTSSFDFDATVSYWAP